MRLTNETPTSLAQITGLDIGYILYMAGRQPKTMAPVDRDTFWQCLSDLIDHRLAGLTAAKSEIQGRLRQQRIKRALKQLQIEAQGHVRETPKET